MTFHPYKKILALLTDDGSVHYWNYETQQLIATTYPYSYGDKKLWSLGSKRLDFSLNEKLIGVAHIDSCCIKNVPINNIIPIYLVFAENHLPKELKDLILTLLYQHLELSYFNIMNY